MSEAVQPEHINAGRDRDALTAAIAGLVRGSDESAGSLVRDDVEALQGQLTAAQHELDLAMLDLRDAGVGESALAALQAQSQALAQFQRTLADGGPVSVHLRDQIVVAVAASSVLAVTGRDVALASKNLEAASMAALSAATRRTVQDVSRDIYERRIFDPYLQFASAEDEAEYRRREAETKRYIDAELAKGTPEGDLNAAGAAQGQMLDAAAHGADRSPEFKERWDALKESARAQREALRAEGRSTEEYDQRIEASVRRFLKSKGKTDAEIDAILASHADPLDAVEPYLENEKDARALDKDVKKDSPGDVAANDATPSRESNANNRENAAAHNDGVFAQFSAIGISYGGDDCRTPDDAEHGLAVGACRLPDGFLRE